MSKIIEMDVLSQNDSFTNELANQINERELNFQVTATYVSPAIMHIKLTIDEEGPCWF
jgi:hypothetical protein